jgi:hypothetical protein
MRQGIVSAPTMREALMQTQPQQGVAEILSQGLPEMMPDLGGATSSASRQRQIADMLLQGAQSQDNTSIAGGLSQLGQAFLARKAGQKADTAEDKQREMASLLMQQAMQGGEQGQASLQQLLTQNPDAAMQYLIQANAPKPERDPIKLGANEVLIGPDGQPMASNMMPEKPVAPGSAIGKLRADLEAGIISPADYEAEITRMQRSGVSVNVNGFGGGATSLAQIPVGQPVPEDLLGGITLPADTYAVRADNPAGFQFETIPGSETDQKAQSGEQAKAGRTYTLGSLIGSYSTLAKNKAISARGNSALDNAAAMYSGTAFGQVQDKLGGEVGNLANAEARDTIQGLSMKALMDMISMSDVSAKAMDSDAEMKAWLSAIKSDNYESALTKLHVLDLSFGSGQELERAYADGTIDLNTYQYVTNRVNSDPMVKQMLDKADRYAALGNAVGQSNLTGGERQSIQNLSGLVAPDGSAVTEDDIQETMAATGMTREQIITRLRGK